MIGATRSLRQPCGKPYLASTMVKPLTFKGDKKTKKRKAAPSDDTDASISKEVAANHHGPEDDDSWVTADTPSDIAGPLIFVLPLAEPSCLACDASGKVFIHKLENLVEGDPLTAEPHDVRQVWIANRIVGTEKVSFKGHNGRCVLLTAHLQRHHPLTLFCFKPQLPWLRHQGRALCDNRGYISGRVVPLR